MCIFNHFQFNQNLCTFSRIQIVESIFGIVCCCFLFVLSGISASYECMQMEKKFSPCVAMLSFANWIPFAFGSFRTVEFSHNFWICIATCNPSCVPRSSGKFRWNHSESDIIVRYKWCGRVCVCAQHYSWIRLSGGQPMTKRLPEANVSNDKQEEIETFPFVPTKIDIKHLSKILD